MTGRKARCGKKNGKDWIDPGRKTPYTGFNSINAEEARFLGLLVRKEQNRAESPESLLSDTWTLLMPPCDGFEAESVTG